MGVVKADTHIEVLFCPFCNQNSEFYCRKKGGFSCKSCKRTRRSRHPRPAPPPKTKARNSWQSVIDRCTKPSTKSFKYYGGRGITVCERWMAAFDNFLTDMGLPPPNCTIDRIENALGYFKENCRWATPTEQARNKTNNVNVTINGITKTITEWAEEKQIVDAKVISWRILVLGWDPVRAVCEENQHTKTISHQGLTLTITEWALRLNVPRRSIESRLDKGWDPARALATPFKGNLDSTRAPLELNGEIKLAKDWAAQAGISRATFTKRRNAGWSLERIISTPPKKNKKAV